MKKPELLAPAGSYDIMKTAFKAGADAVYIGGRLFGARAYADNPDQEMLLRAIDYAHLHGRRLYLTVNTLVKNRELEELLPSYIEPLYRQGLDAVLVQDFGIMDYLHRTFPDLPLHASTQMTVCTPAFGQWLKETGVTRLVLPRELNLQEIARIRQQTGLDIEIFVHGALCYCYSGQCLMSSLIGGRSGNRGRCAQPCRQMYTADGGDFRKTGYLLSPKDLCGLDALPSLIRAGVDSLKIEGRMKSAEYVAGTVSIYRKYIDLCCRDDTACKVKEYDRNLLMELFNRGGFTDGYFRRHNGAGMISADQPDHQGLPVGTAVLCKGRTILHTDRPLSKGDRIRLPGGRTCLMENAVRAGAEITLPKAAHTEKRDQSGTVYRIRNEELINRLHTGFVQNPDLQEPADAEIAAIINAPLTIKVNSRTSAAQASGEPVQKAQKRPVTRQDIEKQVRKTGGTPYHFDEVHISLSNNAFIPLQKISALRRKALERLEDADLAGFRREMPKAEAVCIDPQKTAPHTIGVLASTPEQLREILRFDFAKRIILDLDRNRESFLRMAKMVRQRDRQLYIGMPSVIRTEKAAVLEEDMKTAREAGPDGYLVRSIDGLLFLRHCGITEPAAADWNLYAMNDAAGRVISQQTAWITLPMELNKNELHALAFYHRGEMIVYGRQQLMVTAGCIRRTADRCTHIPGMLTLTDRKKISFPVRNVCRYCYNLIYNSAPLYLPEETALFARGDGPAAIRLQFTDESAAQTAHIMEIYRRLLAGENAAPDFPYTRGHYNRGVE